MVNNDPKGVWFKEGNESFRFGVDEFCLINSLKGVKYGDAEVRENDRLIDTYFPKMTNPKTKTKNKKRIKRAELRDTFMNCTTDSRTR